MGRRTSLPSEDEQLDAIVTDRPYYDAIPYSALSDFFYVWLKRTASPFPDVFRTPLTRRRTKPSSSAWHKLLKQRKDKVFYENIMFAAFAGMQRVLP